MVSERKGETPKALGYWDYVRYAMGKQKCECLKPQCEDMKEKA